MRLSDMPQKSQNLHFIRFLAAINVIISHAYIISLGEGNYDFLGKLTHGQLTLGPLAVSVFFLCGGFLISKSVSKQKKFTLFLKTRITRLFPSLCFVTVLVMFFGVFFSNLSPVEYYTQSATWKYLLNSLLILVHNLPGVFENNPYLQTVNGSLWTLPVEFLCYMGCFVVYKIRCLCKKTFPITIPMVILCIIAINCLGRRVPSLLSVLRPCLLFYIGMAFWVYRDYIILKVNIMVFCIIGFILTVIFKVTDLGMLVFFPYIMFTIWFGIKQCSAKLGDLGNYSYGIYLWAFPVQQAIVYCNGGIMNPYINMLVAIPISFILGKITYNLVEKRF